MNNEQWAEWAARMMKDLGRRQQEDTKDGAERKKAG